MSYNGSGVFNINTAGQPVVTGTVISSTAFNALTADLATGLTTALTKDGQTTPTANIPMGGFKITGIAAATTLGDALSYGRAATVSTLTNSALTSGRVPYASTAGLLTDSANLTFNGSAFAVTGTVGVSGIITSTVTSGQVLAAGSATTGGVYSNFANTGGTLQYGVDNSTGSYIYSGSSNYAGFIGTSAATPLVLATNAVVRATITSAGNVGIGTASPSAKLHVNGGIYSGIASTTSGSLDMFSSSNDTQMGILNNGTELKIYSTYNVSAGYKPINFYTSDALKMTLDNSGNLLVGTTSAIAKIASVFDGSTNNGCVLRTSTNASGTGFLYFQQDTNTCGSVVRVGTTSAVVYNTTSDYRLKTVIGSVTEQGSRIDALNPIDYKWKEDNSQTRGFLAHEFQIIYPNSVTGEKDAVDFDGNPVYQGMQAGTAEVIADLVAELQSLRKRVAQLEG
jgi:hypothetical protein